MLSTIDKKGYEIDFSVSDIEAEIARITEHIIETEEIIKGLEERLRSPARLPDQV